jgi:hypothetical protein
MPTNSRSPLTFGERPEVLKSQIRILRQDQDRESMSLRARASILCRVLILWISDFWRIANGERVTAYLLYNGSAS